LQGISSPNGAIAGRITAGGQQPIYPNALILSDRLRERSGDLSHQAATFIRLPVWSKYLPETGTVGCRRAMVDVSSFSTEFIFTSGIDLIDSLD
jgi:hypothetical protein